MINTHDSAEDASALQALVANTPGLLFQFQLDASGEIDFVFLSDGCQPLLGVSADALKQDANLFYAKMQAKDRSLMHARIVSSEHQLDFLNWEGRVWLDGGQDT